MEQPGSAQFFHPGRAWGLAALLAGAAAATLSVLPNYVTIYSDKLIDVLFYFLFPGMVAQMIIAPEHGGTAAQETLAPLVAAAVNFGVYAFGVLLLRALTRRTP